MNEPDLLETVPVRPRRRRKLLGCAVVLLVLFTACGGFYGFLIYSTDRDTKQVVEELDRQNPDGWTLDAIEAHRKAVADEENAALVVQALKAKMPKPPQQWPIPRKNPVADGGPGPNGVPPRSAPGDPVYVDNDVSDLPPEVQLDVALLRDLRGDLEAAGPALVEARKLPGLNRGRFPIHWAKDGISTIINSQDARTAANLLRDLAVLEAQEGHADQALEATRGILVAGRSVGDEPTLISVLIRIACTSVATKTLERALAQGEPSEAELKKMQDLLQEEIDEPILLNAARGERASMHQLMLALKSGDVKLSALSGGSGSRLEDFIGAPLARGSHARMLRFMSDFVDAARLPPEEQAEPIRAFEIRAKQAKVQYDVLIALLVPAVQKVSEAFRRDQAYLRCALVGVAAERYRRDHGTWPDKPADLIDMYLKALPVDPYDGQPLRYKKVADGVLVYSVGPDKQDNGGVRNRQNPLAKGTDYVFRLWNVERRRQPAAEVLGAPDEAIRP